MSEHLHPAIHPDADLLSAFVEGVLPEHERVACLEHLAECPRCRDIVYFAQEPAPVADEPVRFPKRWFAPIPALSFAAAVCVLVVSIAVYQQYNKPLPQAPQITASIRPLEVAPPAPEMPKQPPASAPRAKARVNREPTPAAAPPPPPPAATPATFAPAMALAGIAGTVTDPAGAVVPKAQINVVDDATGRSFTSTSDASGQFNVAGLAPGRYQLNILSPGFKQTSRKIDLQPQEVAKADSILEIGAATDTVTVNAEASLLKTESGQLSATAAAPAAALPVLPANRARLGVVGALPDKLSPVTTAAKGKLMLRADSTGGLFLSKNAGKSWKAVKGPWKGKVVRLAVVPDPTKPSNALFQLTTDSASVWLSRDGNRWYQASAQR
jgi:hypothetical protein